MATVGVIGLRYDRLTVIPA